MELAARTGAWSGKALPYLRRVSYLESDGNQYIDTEIIPKAGYSFLCDVTCLQDPFNTVYWGMRQSGDSSSYNSQCYFNSNTSSPIFGNFWLFSTSTATAYINWNSGILATALKRLKTDFIRINEMLTHCTYAIQLFGFNVYGNRNTSLGVCRIHEWSCKNELNELIANFIPVIDLSGRPCFYDEVRGQFFYNQGTGEFTWGELDAA